MRTSEQTDQLNTALAKAQGQFPAIPRDRQVRVKMKSGDTYTFKYAPLDTILEKVRPALALNQLCLIQGMSEDQNAVVTRLGHSSGQWIEHAIRLPRIEGVSIQDLGGLITYCKRYGAEAALGVVATDDDDANGASGHEATFSGRSGNGHAQAAAPSGDAAETRPVPAQVIEGIFDSDAWSKSEEHEFAFAIEKRETEGQYGKPASYWDSWERLIADGLARKGVKKSKAGKDLVCYFRQMVEVPQMLMDWLNDVLLAAEEASGPGDDAVLAWLRKGVETAGSTADKWTDAQRAKVLASVPDRIKEMAADVLV
jgi:hypothetical protein